MLYRLMNCFDHLNKYFPGNCAWARGPNEQGGKKLPMLIWLTEGRMERWYINKWNVIQYYRVMRRSNKYFHRLRLFLHFSFFCFFAFGKKKKGLIINTTYKNKTKNEKREKTQGKESMKPSHLYKIISDSTYY